MEFSSQVSKNNYSTGTSTPNSYKKTTSNVRAYSSEPRKRSSPIISNVTPPNGSKKRMKYGLQSVNINNSAKLTFYNFDDKNESNKNKSKENIPQDKHFNESPPCNAVKFTKPGCKRKSPMYSRKSPMYSQKSPMYSQKSPMYSEKSSMYSGKSPKYSGIIKSYSSGKKRHLFTSQNNKTNKEEDEEDDDNMLLSDRYKAKPLQSPNSNKSFSLKKSGFTIKSPSPLIINKPKLRETTEFLMEEKSSPTENNDENLKPYQKSTENENQAHYMMGFPNYGNTCYLNAVLQTLIGLETFVADLGSLNSTNSIVTSSITLSIWNVVLAKYKKDEMLLQQSLREMKNSIEKIDDNFSGFKMQDATELLTQLLDTMKDEISQVIKEHMSPKIYTTVPVTKEEPSIRENISIFDTPSPDPPISVKLSLVSKEEDCTNNNVDLSANPIISNFEFELLETFHCQGCGDYVKKGQQHFSLYVSLLDEKLNRLQNSIESYMSEDKRELTCTKCGHKSAIVTTSFQRLPRILIVQLKRYEYDPDQQQCIKVSSHIHADKWLSMESVSHENVQKPPPFLSMPFNLNETKERKSTTLRNLESDLNKCNVPSQSTDASLFSPIKKETNTETAENDSPTKLVELDEELETAIKFSLRESNNFGCSPNAKMEFTEDDSPQKSVHEDASPTEENAYRLASIVSHFGQTTNTGHYVADLFNVKENQWFHYDDESVSKVSEDCVFSEGRQKNGYIFFYVHKDVYNGLITK